MACEEKTKKQKRCQDVDAEELIFGDLRSGDEQEECNSDGTYANVEIYQPVLDPIFDF